MRIFILVLVMLAALGTSAQQEFQPDEVLAFTQIKLEAAQQMDILRQQPPPGLNKTDMSLERYGEILRCRLTGGDIHLSPQDSASLELIAEAVQRQESALLDELISKSDLAHDRFKELEYLRSTSREFAQAYLSALDNFSKKDDD